MISFYSASVTRFVSFVQHALYSVSDVRDMHLERDSLHALLHVAHFLGRHSIVVVQSLQSLAHLDNDDNDKGIER